jgi:hypothetical protein
LLDADHNHPDRLHRIRIGADDFWTNDLRRPRMLAILSNIAFISYGALVWLPPVLCTCCCCRSTLSA